MANRYKNANLLSRQFKGRSDCWTVVDVCAKDVFVFVHFSEARLSVLRRHYGVVAFVSCSVG